MVYVQNKNGEPLMPCHRAVARKLLKQRKAYVARKDFFTIRLRYGSSGYKQEATLGIDTGSKHVGFSVTTERNELISGTAELRTDVVKRISDRRFARHNRRIRKTRYRKTRFLNRISMKRKGSLAPSLKQKIQSHINIVNIIKQIIPVAKICVETVRFNPQKIKKKSVEKNKCRDEELIKSRRVRSHIIDRDKGACQHCFGTSDDKRLELHHIETRCTGGNAPNNLVILCHTCHNALHKGEFVLNIERGESFRDMAAVNIIRLRLIDEIRKIHPNVSVSYGYDTEERRQHLGLLKEHRNDAFCVTGNILAKQSKDHYIVKLIARHNRSLHLRKPKKKGIRQSHSAPYWIKGSRLTRYDKVLFNQQICFISGSSHGYAILKLINGKKAEGYKTSVSCKKIKLITH